MTKTQRTARVGLWLALAIASPLASFQTIVENPAEPLSKRQGRILPLKEVLRIRDEGRAFFLKLPWGLDAALEGSIFVQDGLKLYKFAPNGSFIANLAKTGQGPGEFSTELTDFQVGEDGIHLFSAPSNKILKVDFAGGLLKEKAFDKKMFHHLLACDNQRYYLTDLEITDFGRTEGIKDYRHNVFIVDEASPITPTSCFFTTQIYLQIRTIGGRSAAGSSNISRLRISSKSRNIVYVADTQEYLIKQFDLQKAAVTRTFRRSYPRVRNQKKDPRDTRRMPDFENDVHRLLIHNDHLWVLTSNYDPKKGVLVDVFNAEGTFIDSFILPLLNIRTGDEFSQRYFPLMIRGDFLYTIEHDADWTFSVAKYEIPKF